MSGVGPAKHLQLEFARRLNLLTGDNGLGKSFILENAWWALCGHWITMQALPRADAQQNEPKIEFQIANGASAPQQYTARYQWEAQSWRGGASSIPALVLYGRVDGTFAVADPMRDQLRWGDQAASSSVKPIVFTQEEIWNGLEVTTSGGKTQHLANGLITDWVNWQNSPEQEPFETLKQVLLRLSPPSLEVGDLGHLVPGKPWRIPGDSRLIPTIVHPYGEVPILYASAGVKRIVALAYLIVWAWEEHKIQSALNRKATNRRMVILVDEIESHLHPQWQRAIVPALMNVWQALQADVQMQLLIATHSPLVMASVEPTFDPNQDQIFHIELVKTDGSGAEVVVEKPEFIVHGTVDSWLRSDIFELGQARSIEAEQALADAKNLQIQEEVNDNEVAAVHQRLSRYLSAHDEFWPRWTYFAAQHGVEL